MISPVKLFPDDVTGEWDVYDRSQSPEIDEPVATFRTTVDGWDAFRHARLFVASLPMLHVLDAIAANNYLMGEMEAFGLAETLQQAIAVGKGERP